MAPLNFHTATEFDNFIGTACRTAAGATVYADLRDAARDRLLGELPEYYRELVYHVPGEHVFKRGQYPDTARGGETTATLGLATATEATIKVFYNYPFAGLSWANRHRADEVSSGYWSFVATTNVMTFDSSGPWGSGLKQGDSIIVEYDHNLHTVPETLKTLSIQMAAHLLYNQLYIRSEREADAAEAGYYLEEYKAGIEGLQQKKRGIVEFDNLVLATDITRGAGEWGSVDLRRA